MDYLAAGIDPEKSTIFAQSDIPAIHELMFIVGDNIEIPDMKKIKHVSMKSPMI